MKNFLTLSLSLLLMALTGGTAWLLLTLSGNVEIKRVDPGTSAEVRVP
jgi:hypothetical protein